METLAIALFLSLVVNRIIEYAVKPVKQRYPDLDMWWLVYVAWVAGAALAWVAQINLFADYLPNPLAGLILTAIVVGGGANLLHDIFQSPQIIEVEEVESTHEPFEPEAG